MAIKMHNFTLYACYEEKGTVKGDELAAPWFYKAAANGHDEAQYKLGKMLEAGSGVAKTSRVR